MRLKNGIVLDQDFILSPKDIEVQGEWITALTPWRDEEPGGWIDLSNKLVIPGLIDQHIHGCGGFDVEDASLEALAAMSGRTGQAWGYLLLSNRDGQAH